MHVMVKFFEVSAGFRLLSLLFLVCLLFPFVENFDFNKDAMAGVVLVPGVAGTKVEGRWHTKGEPKLCDANENDWELLWIRMKSVLGGIPLKCWTYRYQLKYDRVTHKCRNQDGVETRIPNALGSLKPVEYLTNAVANKIGVFYFHDIIEKLEDSKYSSDTSLKAVGYDGRYALLQQEEWGYFQRFAEVVERMARDTKRKVAIVGHSMGGLVAAYFLSKQPQAWKDKHIHSFVSIGTPWLGSTNTLETYLIGTNYGIPTFKTTRMKELVRTFQSVAFLLPTEGDPTVLVDWTQQNKKYTSNDYEQLFRDIGYEDGYLMRQDLRKLFPFPTDLGVKVFCIWSNLTELKTLERYEIRDDIKDPKDVTAFYTEGDGTVSLKSLRYCEKMKGVTTKVFNKYDHLEIALKDDVIDYVQTTLLHAQPFT